MATRARTTRLGSTAEGNRTSRDDDGGGVCRVDNHENKSVQWVALARLDFHTITTFCLPTSTTSHSHSHSTWPMGCCLFN